MTDEAKAARNAYLREWRRRNPDKVRRQHERHWERQAEKRKQSEENGKAAALGGG
jgi:hypothetical protein